LKDTVPAPAGVSLLELAAPLLSATLVPAELPPVVQSLLV